MIKNNNTDSIMLVLNELVEDPSVSKNIKEHIKNVISYLQKDPSMGKDKAITEIEEMSSKNDIEPYLRAQIWNVVSMIETL